MISFGLEINPVELKIELKNSMMIVIVTGLSGYQCYSNSVLFFYEFKDFKIRSIF